MPTEDFIRNRITQLRMNKNISEYQMSLDLGHSKSYIQSISSGRAMPSMGEFLSICEYLEVTPKDFFDEHTKNPVLKNTLVNEINGLSDSDVTLILELIKRLKS
ncbi:MAG: helix-turn-helix domain-containing protein [Oscillospiraceae bacterium]|nr:helix-turn-helix domain-containing protein [Oscillospiraceae bacterium]